MKEAFASHAVIACGALAALVPADVPAQGKRKNRPPCYYFFSPSRLARDLQNTGVMKVLVVDGQNIPYTHKNLTGGKSSRTASLVWFGFGRAPKEMHIIVDKNAYMGHRRRSGAKPAQSLIVTTARPDTPTADFNPRTTLG